VARVVAPALRALLGGIIDYAGSFPPASLSCREAYRNFQSYRQGSEAWALSRFVISSADLDLLPSASEGPFSVLANADHPRANAIESKSLLRTSKPLYCECTIQELLAVKEAGAFAKIRTGGIVPEAIPSVDQLADFILRCAELRLPFKATAGLHHPIRASHPLTYEAGAPSAIMHGFINLFLAAAFAWVGPQDIHPLFSETDPGAFRFDELAHWRDWSLTAGQVTECRRDFAHSFGSCSFTDPLESLQQLGWL
jgi:hypothetical protein